MLELSHKKLDAWKTGIELRKEVRLLTTLLPKEEEFILKIQMNRAAQSVPSNVAEGASRKSKAEKNRFFEIARSSVVELDNDLEDILSLQYLGKENEQFKIVEALVEKEFKILSGLIQSNKAE